MEPRGSNCAGNFLNRKEEHNKRYIIFLVCEMILSFSQDYAVDACLDIDCIADIFHFIQPLDVLAAPMLRRWERRIFPGRLGMAGHSLRGIPDIPATPMFNLPIGYSTAELLKMSFRGQTKSIVFKN